MSAFIHAATGFIVEHPHWAGLLVFATAAAEAIALIGMIIPGTTILVGVGAVAGLAGLSPWPLLVWAILGAIAGDGLSYWVGHRYRDRLAGFRPFARRPHLLAEGEAFFRRHGAKSVAIGRFLPATRAVIPAVAGMMGMSPARFYVANVLSAMVWAPANILPGAAMGVALGVLGSISGRLAAVLVALIVLAAVGVWLLKLAVDWALPVLAQTQGAIVAWARGRPGTFARVAVRTLDPDEPAATTVLVLGLVLVVCAVGFIDILEDVVMRDSIVQADAAISHLIQTLRTPWGDAVMVAWTTAGDAVVGGGVAAAALAWLAWRRKWRLAVGFALALGVAGVFVLALKAILRVPRPVMLYSGADAFSFPSGHATMAATLYGMLAWLISASLPRRWRFVPLLVAGALVGMIAASRIYLAAHWPSDVGAGILFGFALAALFGLVFRRETTADLRPAGLASVALAALFAVGGWHEARRFDANMARYARRDQVKVISERAWLGGAWRRLAQRRIDLDGETEEPFVLQWAGGVQALRARLTAAGWEAPAGWSLRSAAGYAAGSTPARALPALPLLHDGHAAALTLIGRDAGADNRAVLRAWPSGFAVARRNLRQPVLLVSIIGEHVRRPWGLASLPVESAHNGGGAAGKLRHALRPPGDAAAAGLMENPPGKPALLLAAP